MQKELHGYFILSSVTKLIAGFLFEINGYLPFIGCLVVMVITTIMAMCYKEPIKSQKGSSKTSNVKKQLKDIEEGFKYVLKSERLKALVIAASLIASLLSILVNYRTSLAQDIKISASFMGIMAAALSLISAYACTKQEEFNSRFRNKSILVMAFMISISTILAGIVGIKAEGSLVLIAIIMIAYLITKFAHGMFYTIMDRYFRNFTNKNIDTKVFAVKNLFVNATSAMMGIMASFLLDKFQTAYCMIIVGVAFSALYVLMGSYMKARVGLKPEEYSEEERKYDELKEMN